MIYIFDTSHTTQINSITYKHLKKIILKYNIEVIAEEAGFDNSYAGVPTIAYKNKLKYGIKYINIENPNYQADTSSLDGKIFFSEQNHKNELFKLLKTKFNKRERYWRKTILPYKHKNIIVICGAEHFKSFTKKLNQYNLKFKRLNSFMIIDNKIIPNTLFKNHLHSY